MELKVTEYKERPFPHNDRRTASRIYVWPKGETILQNLINRRARPNREYHEAVVVELMRRGVDMSRIKLKWSKHAGCTMCPCSPGFIVDGYDPQLRRKDIHMTVEGDDTGVTLDEAKKILGGSED